MRKGIENNISAIAYPMYLFMVERKWWLLGWYLPHLRFSRLCNKFEPSGPCAFFMLLNLYNSLPPPTQYPLTLSLALLMETTWPNTKLAGCRLYSPLPYPASPLWQSISGCSCITGCPEEINKKGNGEYTTLYSIFAHFNPSLCCFLSTTWFWEPLSLLVPASSHPLENYHWSQIIVPTSPIAGPFGTLFGVALSLSSCVHALLST